MLHEGFRTTLATAKDSSEAEELLLEWFKWWETDDTAPGKLPDAIHIKTAIYFIEKKHTADIEKVTRAYGHLCDDCGQPKSSPGASGICTAWHTV